MDYGSRTLESNWYSWSMARLRMAVAASIAFSTPLANTAAIGQTTSQRAPSNIDWQGARAALERDNLRDKGGIDKFRSAVPSENVLSQVNLPVMVLGTGPVRAAPRFQAQGSAYTAVYALDRAKLSVLGSASAISLQPGSPLAQSANNNPPANECNFETSEDGADLSCTRFGAGYTLRLTCDEPDRDTRCTEPNFLRSTADSLVVVGGSFK
jgi:hypothetical protein